jgi:zinc protease
MNRTSFARALGVAVLALGAQAGAAAAQQAPNLPPAQQIVEKYVQAVGGRQNISKFSARHSTAEMSIPAMGMTMNIDLYQARPNRMFTRVDMPGMGVTTSGYDGQVAWTNNPMQGPRILTGTELNETLRQADFDASLDPAKAYPTMETVGERTVEGHACWNVRMVTRGGTEVMNCFDKESGLLIAGSMKQQSQMGEMQVDLAYSDYKDFDGVKMPTKTTMSMMGQQMTTTLKTVSHEAIPDSTFALPAEIKALQH